MAGLLSAMLLADDGHQVVVLERDPAPPPTSSGDAWESWTRRGVNQFRLLHFLHPRFRLEAEKALPRVITALEAAGALRLNAVAGAPKEITGGPRPDDDAYTTVTARRPVVESVVAACAEVTAAVTVRRGVTVAGVTTGAPSAPGVPHVTGVRTSEGEEIGADLVVDATGRRSPLADWLEAAGGRRPAEEIEESGFVYYGRHFRSDDGNHPPIMGPLLQTYGSVSVLTLPADNGTWGVAIIASGADRVMRAVLDVDTWTAAVRSLPLAAHWLEGAPLEDGVQVMAKIEDRHRRFVVAGEPVATGVVAVADSWACTNPSLGRGITMALMHTLALRDLLTRSTQDDPVSLARAWDEVTTATVEPWYRATVAFDRHRLAEIDSEIRGERYRPDDPVWEMGQALQYAAGRDPDCFRAFLGVVGMLETPEEALARPGVFDRVVDRGAAWSGAPGFGPTRDELMAVVAGASR
jgi:2-polyprenyl-6-methoxyphenol hydroxylase-like FAD-dependent oxidoreductase